ncbi:hypothetical protein ST47_g3163 [Ascochyta rabiei]|uniref:Tc1-like transposase DDE domain-containing protein n=1 Tax=Didymella rabiei TaxID=5454 RepID=A0A163IC83_DIDRA|nr:hypothetical protein ST47_g3163 [Ascochyta rabiei]
MLQAPQKQRRKRLMKQAREAGITQTKRTIQNSLWDRKKAHMFKAAVQSAISDDQQGQRTYYTHINTAKPIEGYWDSIMFTDEAHERLDDFPDEWILRIWGERFKPENIVEARAITSKAVHFAAWINYYAKAEQLTFYNDEYDNYQPLKRDPSDKKPRRRPKTETQDQFDERMAEWIAREPPQLEIKIPGNSMDQNYYTNNILPVYCKAYQGLVDRSDELRASVPKEQRYTWYFQEDNNPSHGTRNSQSKPALYKKRHKIEAFYHPANSPDLNPIEGIWLIIKTE